MSRVEELTEDFGVTLKHMAEQSYKPMTNGDRIRSMSDEVLAWELMMWRFDAFGKATGNQSNLPDSQKTILAYLKQPMKEEIVEHCEAFTEGGRP
jgi:hypothetical protein